MSNGFPWEEVATCSNTLTGWQEGTPIWLGEVFPTVWGVCLERERSLQSGLWGSVSLKDINAALEN